MPRALVPCLTIVAAFQLQIAAAQPLYEDVPVPPALAAAARSIGLDPAADAPTFLSDVVRVLHAPAAGRSAAAERLTAALSAVEAPAAGDPVRVPVPLGAAVWSEHVFRRPLTTADLLQAIVSDRSAALLAYGLAGLDEGGLALFGADAALLRAVYEESAPMLAAFGDSLRLDGSRVAVPGGEAAAELWQGVVGERRDRPAAFVRALLSQQSGRLAYLLDTIASLDPPRAAFALGSWIDDPALRRSRFAALAAVAVSSYDEWNVREEPFARPLSDLAMLLARVRVDERGVPVSPGSRSFWAAAFSSDDPTAPAPVMGSAQDGVADAAWLAEFIGSGNPYARGARLDQISFAQRVFAGAAGADLAEVLAAVRGFRSYGMLLLSLERMGIREARVYADAVRQVSAMRGRDPGRVFWPLVQLQGALAMLTRMAAVGTLDAREAGRLVLSLTGVSLEADRYAGRLGAWIERELLPHLPSSLRPEGRILAGLAGPSTGRGPRVPWEGADYRLDFAAAELDRLRVVRDKQSGHTVDLALALNGIARTLQQRPTSAGMREAADALWTASLEFARELGRSAPDILAPGVRPPANAGRTMAAAAAELTGAARRGDAAAARRVSVQLLDLSDTVLGEALLSLAYAVHLGDPNGTALMGRNVAMRHDFGLSHPDAAVRHRMPWTLPRQTFRPGVPWHVTGSLLGLDIALAPLGLRRLSADLPPDAPALMSIEREAFAVSVALIDPARLRDEDRDAVAEAIHRAGERLAALEREPAATDGVARDLQLTARRRRELDWRVRHAPATLPGMFALAEFVALGRIDTPTRLNAWGTAALASDGCICMRFLPMPEWRLYEGRPQVGQLATASAELMLYVALMLHDLRVPSPLAKPVLSAAALEFIERVSPMHINDWRTLSRAVRDIPRERIEDYVAAAAAVGGPLIPVEEGEARRP